MTSRAESREMVDANVLIYATMTSTKAAKDPAIASFHDRSQDLLRSLPVIRVSAIAWFEYQRRLRDDERSRMAAVLKKVRVERADGPIVEFADGLLRKYRQNERVCQRCLGSTQSTVCPKCGRSCSAQQRLNDAIIVATAHVLRTVDTLWSFDGGVQELGQHCAGCTVQEPKSSLPLLDPIQNKALTQTGGKLVSLPFGRAEEDE